MAGKVDEKHADHPVVTVAPAEESEKTPYNLKSQDIKDGASDEHQYDFTSKEFENIPELVRNVVGFEDDPTLPVLTFRSVVLSAIFCIIGSVVSQLA